MADRGAGKTGTGKTSKRPAKAKPGAGAAGAPDRRKGGQAVTELATPAERIRQLETERDQLRAQLENALARISQLEQGRDLVRNRIDWVIDSLHNLLEE